MQSLVPHLVRLTPILIALIAAPALAATDAECSARADAVVDRMRADAGASLSDRECEIARAAAFAACRGRARTDESDEDDAEVDASPATTLQRFWTGLTSLENRPVRKRSDKYRYVEK